MPHSNLQEPSAPVLLVVQSTANRPVQTACGKVGLDTWVNGLWKALIQPGVQPRQFLRHQGFNRALNVLDCLQ
jgi:hypothetical protein